MTHRPALAFRLACLAAVAMICLIYLPGLHGGFVFDDYSSILGNPAVTRGYTGLTRLFQALFSAPIGGLLRPLSMLSFILNAQISGLSPFGFKLTNLLIHLACGTVLGFVVREILRAYARDSARAMDEATVRWLSLAVAALWLVHPLNLSVVLYVVQRETSLAALFTALAILSYLRGRRRVADPLGGGALMWIVTPLCMLVGMLCKETAALTPLYLLVIECTVLRGRDMQWRPEPAVRYFFLVFLAIPLVAGIILAAIKPGFFFASYAGRDFNMYERVLSECRALIDYLRWVALPDLRQLGLYHDDFTPSRGMLHPWTTLPCVLAVIALLAAAWFYRRRSPLFSFGVLWFFAGHAMESSILPLELVFEHRNYLPLFGPVLACVGLLHGAMQSAGRRAIAAVLIAACGLFAAITTVRAMDWRSELDFAQSEAAHHPASPRAVTELQWAYMNYVVGTHDTRLIPAAVDAAERAKRLDPGSINQDVGLVYMYASIGQLKEAAASLREAAARAPTAKPTPTLQLALQSLMVLAKPEFQPIHADIRAVYRGALANPRVAAAACFHADAWNTYARFQEDSGQIQDALTDMHQSVGLCPGNALLRYNMANMLLRFGDTQDAKSEIDAMRRIGDFRYQDELAALETEYRRQTTQSP